jgi:hypothetical protein
MARATAAAHSVKIIHKDLKPSNIFMRQDSAGRWQPLLADFGIGAVADRAELEKRGITVAGWTQSLVEPGSSRTGTRMYQPPEASAGRPAMMQADVFALGVLLYQVLLGDLETPFGEGWEDELRGAWTRMGLDPATDRRFRLLCGDIRSCVVKDPARRLATAAQVVERIETLDTRIALEEAEEARLNAEREAATARERNRWIRRLRWARVGGIMALVLVACLGQLFMIGLYLGGAICLPTSRWLQEGSIARCDCLTGDPVLDQPSVSDLILAGLIWPVMLAIGIYDRLTNYIQ